jgi:hypothetical protein
MEPAVRRSPSSICLLASILLLGTILAVGCAPERPLRPAASVPPEYASAVLVLEANGSELARVGDRGAVESLLESLPAGERQALLETGTLSTRDPEFMAAVRRLIAAESSDRAGFDAHVRRVTWGEIKIRYTT